MNDRRYMLDASALLALMQGERGADRIDHILRESRISAVNLGEVTAKLDDYGIPPNEVAEDLAGLGLEVVPFDQTQAMLSGTLRRTTRERGLSLGDRACLAAATATQTIAVTSDEAWLEVADSIPVELFR